MREVNILDSICMYYFIRFYKIIQFINSVTYQPVKAFPANTHFPRKYRLSCAMVRVRGPIEVANMVIELVTLDCDYYF